MSLAVPWRLPGVLLCWLPLDVGCLFLGLITLLFFVVLAGLVVWWVCCGLRWFPGVWFLLHGLVGFWVCGFDGGCGCFVGVGVVGCSYWLIVLVFAGSGRLLLFVVS